MAETRKEIKERLQAAGVWEEYLTQREQLAKDGLTPAQARDEALRRIESRPTTQAEQPAPTNGAPTGDPPNEPTDWNFNGQSVPNPDAVEWVAQNLANANVRPPDAPSGLAWGLLTWARRTPANQSAFWNGIWSKLLPTASSRTSQKEKADDDDDEPDLGTEKCLALVDNWLKDYQRKQVEEDAELAKRPNAAEFAGTLQKRLAAVLEREKRLRERVEQLERGGAGSA